jgi:hypothetical protein
MSNFHYPWVGGIDKAESSVPDAIEVSLFLAPVYLEESGYGLSLHHETCVLKGGHDPHRRVWTDGRTSIILRPRKEVYDEPPRSVGLGKKKTSDFRKHLSFLDYFIMLEKQRKELVIPILLPC